jgi:hypothetical protein
MKYRQQAAALAVVCMGAAPQTYYYPCFWSSKQKDFAPVIDTFIGI